MKKGQTNPKRTERRWKFENMKMIEGTMERIKWRIPEHSSGTLFGLDPQTPLVLCTNWVIWRTEPDLSKPIVFFLLERRKTKKKEEEKNWIKKRKERKPIKSPDCLWWLMMSVLPMCSNPTTVFVRLCSHLSNANACKSDVRINHTNEFLPTAR